VLLTAGLLAFSLAAPGAVMAAGFTVQVPGPMLGPNPNDTANIQKALDTCAAYGPNCTVQLQAGKYHTSQLVEYGFKGTFKGRGEGVTIIEARPNLTVGWMTPYSGSECAPNTTTCLWPNLIMFVNGAVEVSDLAISEPNTGAAEATPWPCTDCGTVTLTATALYDVLAFTGQYRADASVDRVSITGAPDGSATSFYGYNLINGIDYSGFYPNGLGGHYGYMLIGSFSLRNSALSWAFNPVAVDGPHEANHVTIGGAPGAGNSFDNAIGGIDLESAQRSVFDVSYNTSAATHYGMWVSYDPSQPTSPSQYLIHDNRFVTAATYGSDDEGIFLYDNSTAPYIQAKIWDNTINVLPGNSGIDVFYSKGTMITGNTITGTDGYDGIGLWGATYSAVIANNVSGLTVDPSGYAQIFLSPFADQGAATANNLVVCLHRTDQVVDQGTGNKVIGCDPSTATPKAAVGTGPVPHMLGLKVKPFLP